MYSSFLSDLNICATIIRYCENYYIVTGNGFYDFLWEIKQERQMNYYREKKPYLFYKAMDQDINDHHL